MKIIMGTLATAAMFFMVGCQEKVYYGKIDNTPYATKESRKALHFGREIDSKSKIDKIIVYKKKRKLYTYRAGKKINEFKISLGNKGGANAGKKVRVGDYRTPEGSYTIVRKKCDRRLYKSLMISYPNRADRARAARKGVSPGGYITIHAQPKWNATGVADRYTLKKDWTEGCIAVTNKSMDNLWKSVKNGTRIIIYP